MYQTVRLTDRSRILAYLETDRLYAAYAVGDLEPELFARCAWFGAERDGRLQALALHYSGRSFPIVFAMGSAGGLRAILERALLIKRAFFTCRQEHVETIGGFFEWEPVPMWRMALRPERFRPLGGDCVPLTGDDVEALTALYASYGEDAFDPARVPGGAFHGIFEDGRLVAAAGTHLISPTQGTAAVGNIFTHPDRRRRGYATAATSAVVAELHGRGIDEIVLNVNQDNETAIHIYERLGFRRCCPFFEGMADRLSNQHSEQRNKGVDL